MASKTKYSAAVKSIRDRIGDVGKDSPQAKLVRTADKVAAALDQLERIAQNRDPLHTEAAHVKRVAQAAKRYAQQLEVARNEIARYQVEAMTSFDDAINSRASLTPTAYAAEIRQRFLSMGQAERAKQINQAIFDGKGEIVAALTSGPGILSGLSDDEVSRYRQSFREHSAPEVFKAQASYINDWSNVQSLMSTLENAASHYENSPEVAKIDALSDAARDADAAFSASLSAEG